MGEGIVEPKMGFWKVLGTIFASAWRKYKSLIIVALILALLTGLTAALVPKLMQQIIDMLIKGDASPTEFRKLVLLMAGASLFGVITYFFTSKITFYIATQTEDYWRFRVLKHFYMLPLRWHDQQDSGQIGGRIDRGGGAIYSIINDIFGQDLFISFVTFIVVLIASIIVAPSFWWIFILPIPIYVFFTYYLGEKIAKRQEELNSLADDAGRTLYDGISNVRSVKAFGKEEEETGRYKKKWSFFHIREYELEKVYFTRTTIQNLIEIGMKVLLIILSFYAITSSQMTVGTMVMLMTYQGMLFGPLGHLNSVFARLRRVASRSAGLFEIIKEEDPLEDAKDAVELGHLKDEIELRNLTFSYGKDGHVDEHSKIVLEGVTLTLKAGTTTALVGRSGSGKSTLTLMLMRFHDPLKGAICWDGIELRQATRNSLRREIALVPQDTSLFNRTIWENISYGKQDATMEEVIAAAKRAHAHDFIMQLPQGYDSIVGERGVKLSGGQRQRIAIARVLILQPSLLILDESTSHLDTESEQAIQDSISFLQEKTTQVIIAHRLSTVLHADNIVVMDKGKVVAQGKHEELLETCEVYRHLYTLQFTKSHGDVAAKHAATHSAKH